jgi:hypothetical protein
MAEWSEGHVAAIGSFKLKLWFSWLVMVKLLTGRAS